VVATTRFPHFAAHLSRDGGRTWDPPMIVDHVMLSGPISKRPRPSRTLWW
jgi:hypothetical protein